MTEPGDAWPENGPGLVECRSPGGRVRLVSPRMEARGILHGFTTRLGGIDVRTAADLAGPLADAGVPGARVHLSHQPHGARVSSPGDRESPADAHFSPPGGDAVAVRTADCVGVLLAGPGGVVAAHAGWRGLIAGVLDAAVRRLGGGAGVDAAAISPAISIGAFEVGPEVAEAFRRGGWMAHLRPGVGDRSHLDICGVAITQLGAAGVPASRIDAARRCTLQEPATFYSYRRDGRGSGHQAAWIRP